LKKQLLLVALVALLVAGCSQRGTQHWRRDTANRPTLIDVEVPASTPYGANGGVVLKDAVDTALRRWNRSPDIQLVRVDPGTCSPTNLDQRNCFQVWTVPSSIEANAFSRVWGDGTHLYSTDGGSPADWSRVVINQDWLANADLIKNAVCHEIGHQIGLQHFDPNGDNTPDAEGPCVNGHPDPYDRSNVDRMYNICHVDPSPAPNGWTEVKEGQDRCTGGAADELQIERAPGGLHAETHRDTRADLDG
jgi:hypothetical protein